jgi:uncharacterized protein YjbI with pentapeptide repeats
MKTYTQEELKEIIELHQKWLNGEEGGVRANLTDTNLTCANLTYANLIYANLTGANLTGANLTDTNLTCANLTYANLTGANLTNANLTGANLTCADLNGAELFSTIGNDIEIKSLQVFNEYRISYTKDRLQIGCENHSFEEWWTFSDKEILAMDGKKALSFWKKNKEMIKNIVESNPAV